MAKQYADSTFLIGRVPETDAVNTAHPTALGFALADAEEMISLDAYGTRSDAAHAYYAAHLLACRYSSLMGGENAGPVAGKKAGEIEVSFAVAGSSGAPAEDRPNSTKWGRLFLQQQRLAGATRRVVG